jgi:small-conductance mechanosensitive channel
MKKNVITFGLIAGGIVACLLAITTTLCYSDGQMHGSMLVGYATMLIAFSMIFVAVKNYRDKFNGGQISFGKGFMIGLYISLIASTFYVITWLVIYYRFMPDFMDRYATYTINQLKSSGASQQEINKQIAQMDTYKQLYKSPVWVILFTYMEILPIGLIVAATSALILKRKPADNIIASN